MIKRLSTAIIFTACIIIIFSFFALKGQDDTFGKIAVRSTKSEFGAIYKAAEEFQKQYHFPPGDLPNPQDVIPSCEERTCHGGNGDKIVGEILKGETFNSSGEQTYFWEHLYASGLLSTQITQDMALGGRLFLFYYDGTIPLPYSYQSNNHRKGHYFVLTGNDKINEHSSFLLPEDASSIDKGLDDGIPTVGTVIAAGQIECVRQENNSEKFPFVYNEKNKNKKVRGYNKPCAFLYLRMGLDSN